MNFFSKIKGECEELIIKEAARKISATIAELALPITNKAYGSKIGGDPLLYQLLYPSPHICDARGIQLDQAEKRLEGQIASGNMSRNDAMQEFNALRLKLGKNIIYTAATNGKEFFWNPEFVNKQTVLGLRLLAGHEGCHSVYMHAERIGSRKKNLWAKAVDFKTNYLLIQDLKARGFYDAEGIFRKEMGEFITLQEYSDFLKDPWNPPPKMEQFNPIHELRLGVDPKYQRPNTYDSLYYADGNLHKELKSPENIYDYILSKIPKCKCCGRIPHYKKPTEAIKLLKEIEKMHNVH